jgi:hypothetical protein
MKSIAQTTSSLRINSSSDRRIPSDSKVMDIGLCVSPPPSQASKDAANIIIQGAFRILSVVLLNRLGQLNWIHRLSLK